MRLKLNSVLGLALLVVGCAPAPAASRVTASPANPVVVSPTSSTAPTPGLPAGLTSGTSLSGRITAPAGIVAQGGGNFVGQNGSAIVAQGGGNAIGENSSGIIGENGGAAIGENSSGYRLQDDDNEQPLAGVTVALLDASGAPILGADGVALTAKTDAQGNYKFASAPLVHDMIVSVDLGAEGQLVAIAPIGVQQVDANLVSTLAAGFILDEFVGDQADATSALDKLTASAESATRAQTTAAIAQGSFSVPTALTSATVAASVSTLRERSTALDSELETVDTLVSAVGDAAATATAGPALGAQFKRLVAVVADAHGNLYVADALDNTIREVTSAGRLKTLAGSGEGSADTTPTGAASFAHPVAIDRAKNGLLYVADGDSGYIRTVNANGKVKTLQAGGKSLAFPGLAGLVLQGNYVVVSHTAGISKIAPNGTTTLLAGPSAGVGPLALDAAGTLYLADGDGNRVCKISTAGVVTTLAGPGTKLSHPQGIAADPSGTVYVSSGSLVRAIAPDGTVSTLAGMATSGSVDAKGTKASFNAPAGLVLDSRGALYVADGTALRKISKKTEVSTVAGAVAASSP